MSVWQGRGSCMLATWHCSLYCLSAEVSVCVQGVSAVKWSHDSRHLFVGSTDHNLRIFGGDASAMAS